MQREVGTSSAPYNIPYNTPYNTPYNKQQPTTYSGESCTHAIPTAQRCAPYGICPNAPHCWYNATSPLLFTTNSDAADGGSWVFDAVVTASCVHLVSGAGDDGAVMVLVCSDGMVMVGKGEGDVDVVGRVVETSSPIAAGDGTLVVVTTGVSKSNGDGVDGTCIAAPCCWLMTCISEQPQNLCGV